MKILIVAVHFPVTGARYVTDAFKRLGCDVRHIGVQVPIHEAWGVNTPVKYDWKPDGGFNDYVSWQDWIPNLIILADTLVKNWPLSWYSMEHPDIPIIYWSQDNHVRNVRQNGIVHYFLAHHGWKDGKPSAKFAQPVQYPDETWLPCGFDDLAFTPSPIPFDRRAYDVCLIGVMYPRRQKLVSMLQAAGLKVLAATGLIYDEYRAAYQNARISLCVSANRDVAQRIFETSAMGCHVLTDPLLDLSDEKTNKALGLAGFSVYWSDEDCVARVKDLLSEENRTLVTIASQQMQHHVMRTCKWTDRAKVILDWYEEYMNYKALIQSGIETTILKIDE